MQTSYSHLFRAITSMAVSWGRQWRWVCSRHEPSRFALRVCLSSFCCQVWWTWEQAQKLSLGSAWNHKTMTNRPWGDKNRWTLKRITWHIEMCSTRVMSLFLELSLERTHPLNRASISSGENKQLNIHERVEAFVEQTNKSYSRALSTMFCSTHVSCTLQ